MEITFAGKFDKGRGLAGKSQVVYRQCGVLNVEWGKGEEGRLTVYGGFSHYLHDSYYSRFFAVAVTINNISPGKPRFLPCLWK